MVDIRFRNPCSFVLSAASQSGKSTFVFNLLRNINSLFIDPRCAQNVLFFYNEWQSIYDEIRQENLVTRFIKTAPTYSEVNTQTLLFRETGGSVIVLDDYGDTLTNDIVKLFTTGCHHFNLVLILTVQNLFIKNPLFRTISLNCTYMVIFRNPRDKSQIVYYSRQFHPSKPKTIINIFEEATDQPYSYLLFDHHQQTSDFLRIRSHVLPNEFPPIVWSLEV